MNKRVDKYFFHSAATAATLTDANTISDLANGQVGIFKENFKGLAAGNTYKRNEIGTAVTDGIYVVQRIGVNDYYISPKIYGGQITSIRYCAYDAPTSQQTTISQTLGTAPDGLYTLRILYKYNKDIFSHVPQRIDYSYYAVGKTYTQVMDALAALVNKDKNVRRAVTATSATVGPVRVLTLNAIAPLGSGLGMYDWQACEVYFDAVLVAPDNMSTVGTVATPVVSYTGKGAVFAMLRAEDYSKGYYGQDNRRLFPVDQPRYFANTAGVAGWNTVTIEHFTRHTTGDIGANEYEDSPITTQIAFRSDLAGAAKTALFGGFNTFIASTPGNFTAV